MVVGMLANPKNTVPGVGQTKILWLNDGGTFSCLVTGYTDIEPCWLTSDVFVPAGDALRHLGIPRAISNLIDKHSSFAGENPSAMDILEPSNGRAISVILTKTW